MKKIINTIALTIVILTGLTLYSGSCGGLASQVDLLEVKKDLKEHRLEFRAEMDSLNLRIDSLSSDVRYIKSDTDSLKKGQMVIYRNVKKVADKKTFLENINDLF